LRSRLRRRMTSCREEALHAPDHHSLANSFAKRSRPVPVLARQNSR
jgi:hypothetical protein